MNLATFENNALDMRKIHKAKKLAIIKLNIPKSYQCKVRQSMKIEKI